MSIKEENVVMKYVPLNRLEIIISEKTPGTHVTDSLVEYDFLWIGGLEYK